VVHVHTVPEEYLFEEMVFFINFPDQVPVKPVCTHVVGATRVYRYTGGTPVHEKSYL
jgi:hypothetical protein